jgi:hypothetical protein
MTAICAALAALLFSCNTAGAMTPLDLSVTTDGGFTGRGLGSVTIKDDRATTERCDAPLTDAEKARLEKLVGAADPSSWRDSYGDADGHPDQVKYTLTLGGHTTSWRDEDKVPADVRALYEAAWHVRSRVAATCT